jgi:hypothetical protein
MKALTASLFTVAVVLAVLGARSNAPAADTTVRDYLAAHVMKDTFALGAPGRDLGRWVLQAVQGDYVLLVTSREPGTRYLLPLSAIHAILEGNGKVALLQIP